ncbi:hypothetical protein PoMZ_10262 [Pyricularia oryzae]|uniref:Uncharacterized protein n=1 Tax=Pyricularia oryzae TaxID=318829 RepID=A0A4P7MZR2_PYROR|nr:hypothetical protein PoMZ_10262 [Pyricularia oryzae]
MAEDLGVPQVPSWNNDVSLASGEKEEKECINLINGDTICSITLPSCSSMLPIHSLPPSTSAAPNLTVTQPLTLAADQSTLCLRSMSNLVARHFSSGDFAGPIFAALATASGVLKSRAPSLGSAANSDRKNSPS